MCQLCSMKLFPMNLLIAVVLCSTVVQRDDDETRLCKHCICCFHPNSFRNCFKNTDTARSMECSFEHNMNDHCFQNFRFGSNIYQGGHSKTKLAYFDHLPQPFLGFCNYFAIVGADNNRLAISISVLYFALFGTGTCRRIKVKKY